MRQACVVGALVAIAFALAPSGCLAATLPSSCDVSWADSNGTVFPLQYVANILYSLPNVSIGTTHYDVTFALCSPVLCPSNHTHTAGFLPSVCHVPLTSNDARFMGTLNVTSFADGESTLYSTPNFAITFGGGDQCHNNGKPNRQTTIHLVCRADFSSDEVIMLGEPSYCTYSIQLNSPRVCPGYSPVAPGSRPRPHKRGISGGSVVLILFFVGLFLYFAVGMAYKALVVGSRGVEMVPNIGLWRALPGLVVDGCKCVGSCGAVRPSTTPLYDTF